MNKHSATNPKTGRTYTRNSKTKEYAFAVVEDVYYADGVVKPSVLGGQYDKPQYALWTTRLDLAEKTAAKMRARNVAWLAKNADHLALVGGVTMDVQILKAELEH